MVPWSDLVWDGKSKQQALPSINEGQSQWRDSPVITAEHPVPGWGLSNGNALLSPLGCFLFIWVFVLAKRRMYIYELWDHYFSVDCNFTDYFRKCRLFDLSYTIVGMWMSPSDGQKPYQSPRDRNTQRKHILWFSLAPGIFFSPMALCRLPWRSVTFCPWEVFKYLSTKSGKGKGFTREPPLPSRKFYC